MIQTRKISISKYTRTLKFAGDVGKQFTFNKNQEQNAKWLKNEMIKMGPVYVKVGQIISTRTDIFPEYITKELSDLQNNVGYMSFNEVENIFENEFNNPLNNYFSNFDEVPIAAASIGQVHTGILKNHNVKVAVKIQRDNIEEIFLDELSILISILSFIKYMSINNDKQISDLLVILEELLKNVYNETNFIKERKNMIIFHRIFKNTNTIIIPRVYKNLCSKKILTMEYIESKKITSVKQNNEKIAIELMTCFVKNVLQSGYIHCDPHPGNIGINNKGQIVLYDFGMVTRFDGNIKEYFRKIFFALMNKSTNELISFMIKSGLLIPKESNAISIEYLTGYEIVVLERLLEYIYTYLGDLDANQLIVSINNDKYININDLPFEFDTQMIYLFKSFSTLEGVCKEIYTDFNYIDFMSSVVLEFIDIDMLLDKVAFDINTTRISSKSTNENNSNYTKLSLENLTKTIEYQKKINNVTMFLIILYILIFS
tara:strand:- start:3202 stop:4659 length:1458 start_codon:yes stop_codon:yes gene_type:complete